MKNYQLAFLIIAFLLGTSGLEVRLENLTHEISLIPQLRMRTQSECESVGGNWTDYSVIFGDKSNIDKECDIYFAQ